MGNLYRAIRLALRYKYSLITSIVCSMLVAVLWGANISAVYPFVEVVFRGQTLRTWIDDEIKELEGTLKTQQKVVEDLEVANQNEKVENADLSAARMNLKRMEAKLAGKRKLREPIMRYAPNDEFITLIYIVGFLLVGTGVKCAFRGASTVLVASVGQKTSADIRNMFFRARLSDRYLGSDKVGDAAGRISGDVGAIGQAIQVLFGRSIQEPMKMFTCLAGAAFVNWRLLIFSLLIFPLTAFLLLGLARSIRRASHRSFDQTCMLISRMMQTFRGLEVVKAYNMESHERRQFWEHTHRLYREKVKIAFYGALVRANNEFLGVGAMCLSVLAGGYLVLNQKTALFGIPLCATPMDFGQIMLFFAFLIGCTDPLRKLSDVYGTIQGGVAAADRLIPLIDEANMQEENPGKRLRVSCASGNLVFDNVHFHYSRDNPVLKGVSFEIQEGETVAIVGPNGCGKSTLVKLVLRFLEPTEGAIKLGHIDLRDIRSKSFRRQLSLVTQQPILFNDSVADNIAYGSRGAKQAEIIAAAKAAHADEFINETMPQGYDTLCGEFGGRLSGGQQQRIALARAILRDPDILILDEAASQIDPKSEQLIRESLKNFTRDRTTLMITHRMSTLELADRILLMDAGEVVDIGTHDELMERCARYRVFRQKTTRQVA